MTHYGMIFCQSYSVLSKSSLLKEITIDTAVIFGKQRLRSLLDVKCEFRSWKMYYM